MFFKLARTIYEGAPLPMQRVVGKLPFGWVGGKEYRKTWSRGAWLDRQSPEELDAYQEVCLRRILNFACEFVPAYQPYRKLLSRFAARDAIRDFPLLSKGELKNRFGEFVSKKGTALAWESTTGGTSGDQLRFLLDDGAQNREIAFIHRLWARVGYSPRMRKGTFRGKPFPQADQGIYWRENPIYNELQFSPFHINSTTLPEYLAELRRYRPSFLHGYPSALSTLATLSAAAGADLASLRLTALLLGSEGLSEGQRAQLETAFGARVYSWYGHSERVILAGECEHSSAYHHFPDYGFLEILDEKGQPVAEGEVGELVGTGFWNTAMPLIRYRTGDRARKLSRNCSCGRNFEKFDSVEGRWEQEFVIGKRGSNISLAALNMHGPLFKKVIRYQYYQEQPGMLELRLMTLPDFNAEDERELLREFSVRLGDELKVCVKLVADIPLTALGKLRRLVKSA